MSNHDNGPSFLEFILLLLFVVSCCTITFMLGVGVGKYSSKVDAVKSGAGDWVANENGMAEFQWLTEGDTEPETSDDEVVESPEN